MLKKISTSEYKVMPWKNGFGTTAQIALIPENATFPDGDFLWRISSATVRTSSPFSQFLNYDRLLAVWKGAGLKLNGKLLSPCEPLLFPGEEKIDCELVGSEVIDVGVIFNRKKVRASLITESIGPGKTRAFNAAEEYHYLFCAEGSFSVDDLAIKEGETLFLTRASEIQMKSEKGCRFFHIQISLRDEFVDKVQP